MATHEEAVIRKLEASFDEVRRITRELLSAPDEFARRLLAIGLVDLSDVPLPEGQSA